MNNDNKDIKGNSEDYEQIKVIQWLESKGILFSATAQATFVGSYVNGKKKQGFSQIMRNKRLGVRKGVPDIMIFVKSKEAVHQESILLFVEMKREKGGTLSPEQKEWIDCLNMVCNVEARCCKGFHDAINFLGQYIL